MDKTDLISLYLKEREYQTLAFGEYIHQPELNLASFLIFIEQYVKKATECYVEKWDSELPPWLNGCKEHNGKDPAPVGSYEALIKIFALAGAALETYANIDPVKWRETGVKEKWRKGDYEKENT